MKIALIIYLLGGILINIFGGWAERLRLEFGNISNRTTSDSENESPQIYSFKLFSALLIIRLLIIVFFPVALVIIIIDHFRGFKGDKSFDEITIQVELEKEEEVKKKALIENRSFLYFKDTHGGGMIRCHGCGSSEEIIAFTHEFGELLPYSMGNQCQSCGKFHSIDFLGDKRVSPEKCSCGGELSREEPIFCPKCKARDVSYQLSYMT